MQGMLLVRLLGGSVGLRPGGVTEGIPPAGYLPTPAIN